MSQHGVAESSRGAAPTLIPAWKPGDRRRLTMLLAGPLLTLAVVVLLDQLDRRDAPAAHPFLYLLLTVAWAGYRGGLGAATASTLLVAIYAARFGAYSVAAAAAASLALAWLVARLRGEAVRGRAIGLERQEVEALDRRLTFLGEASALLASSLEYETTLRNLARLSVPALADWCTIHLAGESGVMRFVAAAHRDPARDLLVRALGEHYDGRVPFGEPGTEPRLLVPRTEDLRELADDPDLLRIYRALAPATVLQIPLRARESLAGVIVLATAREYGRRLTDEDLGLAAELGQRASLAVENARLYREARDADRRYRMLFDANPQPMWVFEVDSLAFLAVNDAAVRHYGYSRPEFLSMTIMDLLPPDDLPGLAPGLEVGRHRPDTALAHHQRKDGTIVEMELVSQPLELEGRRARLVLATDVTERARARAALFRSEEQLRQAQRMDVVGRLASGVAHDFNNLLTTVRGFSDLLERGLAPEDQRRKDVEQIRRAADRGALLTRLLLTFGRRQTLEPRPLRLGEVLEDLDALLRRLIGADIRLELRVAPDAGLVLMDPGQLEQVILNLVLNARDAMPSGGTLRIEVAERQVARTTRGRSLRAGRYVVLAVSDTGSGLAPEPLGAPDTNGGAASPGRTGLGLSILYGIVRRGGGAMRVASEPGRGTTVKVYLPRVEPEPSEQPPEDLLQPRGSETVLVAEDEEGVRELLRTVLADHGYTVLDARHGRDALMIAERYERPIHLLLTDVVMPEMGGAELARRLTRQRPGLKVLYVSGYTNEEVLRRGIPEPGLPLVQKPFTSEELARKVREVLDAPPAGAAGPSSVLT